MKNVKSLIYFSLVTCLLEGNSQAFAARYYFGQQFSNNTTLMGFFDGEDKIDSAGNPLPDGHIDQREVSFIEYSATGNPILNYREWNPGYYANVQHILDYDITNNSMSYNSSGFDGSKNPHYDNGQYISPVDSSVIDFNGFYYYYFNFSSSSIMAGKMWGLNDCYQNGNPIACPSELNGTVLKWDVDVNALGTAIVSSSPVVFTPIPPAIFLFSSGLLSLIFARKKRQ